MIADQQKAGNKVGMMLHKSFDYITPPYIYLSTLKIWWAVYLTVLYHPFLVSLLYADLLSLHVTIFVLVLFMSLFFASSRLTF